MLERPSNKSTYFTSGNIRNSVKERRKQIVSKQRGIKSNQISPLIKNHFLSIVPDSNKMKNIPRSVSNKRNCLSTRVLNQLNKKKDSFFERSILNSKRKKRVVNRKLFQSEKQTTTEVSDESNRFKKNCLQNLNVSRNGSVCSWYPSRRATRQQDVKSIRTVNQKKKKNHAKNKKKNTSFRNLTNLKKLRNSYFDYSQLSQNSGEFSF